MLLFADTGKDEILKNEHSHYWEGADLLEVCSNDGLHNGLLLVSLSLLMCRWSTKLLTWCSKNGSVSVGAERNNGAKQQ